MEGFQGPTNPNLFGEHLNVEQGGGEGSGLDFNSYDAPFVNSESLLRVDEEEVVVVGHHQQQHFSIPSSQDKMPFLQMLQSVESPPFSPFTTTEPHFQLLLTLQQQQKQKQQCNGRWKRKYMSEVVLDSSGSGTTTHPLELESCITHDFSDSHSPVKSETKEQHCPYSWSCPEVVSSLCNNGGEPNSQVVEKGKYSWLHENQSSPKPTTHYFTKPPPNGTPRERERRKRKRTRPSKNREEVESQRMTHIAVERNRRRQMNDHLNALRSLMPTSFIHRGDQASIIGGAIDFVKELEQLLQSLEAQKRMRKCTKQEQQESSIIPFNGFFTSPQYTTYSSFWDLDLDLDEEEEEEENKSRAAADIEVIVIQTHANLKILSPRRPGQLLRAIAALEDIRLTILHLNITSFQTSVLYSFNLKIEDDCKLGSADEIAAAVHQIFS